MIPAVTAEERVKEKAPPIRERAAEAVSRVIFPPRKFPVGGCLSPHWKIWEREGACAWTVEVLRSGYRLPFKLMPP